MRLILYNIINITITAHTHIIVILLILQGILILLYKRNWPLENAESDVHSVANKAISINGNIGIFIDLKVVFASNPYGVPER